MKNYTDKELEILTALWELGEASVQQVHELTASKSGYTTTLKLMQIMFEKGLLDRRKEGKKHIYVARLDKMDAQRSGVLQMMETLFGGSVFGFAQSFLGSTKPDKNELQKIKDLINRMENDG